MLRKRNDDGNLNRKDLHREDEMMILGGGLAQRRVKDEEGQIGTSG